VSPRTRPLGPARLAGAACLLVLLAAATPARAQPISGRITDTETGAPLPGATVLLPDLDAGAAADAEGRYTVAVRASGPVRVVVSYVGYRAETRRVGLAGAPVVLDVALAPTFVENAAVTVTARAQATDVLDTPQSVAVVDARTLARATGATPMDALDGVAGVRLLRTGPGVAKPVIRGLTAQRVLVVADGVRQEGQGWGDEHGPEIGAAEVDRIEVVRGPLSLLYGSDALGGVIQTDTENLFAAEQPFSAEAAVVGATGTPQGALDLRLGGRSGATVYEGRLGLVGSGQVGTPDGLIPNTALRLGSGTLRLGRRFGAATLLADASRYDARIALFEPELLEDSASAGRFTIDDPHQRVTHDRATLRLNLPTARGRLEVITALQQNRRKEFEGEEGGEAAPAAGGEPALSLRLTTLTTDARFHHAPLGRVFGTVGASGFWQRNETLAEETLIPAARTLDGAVYAAETAALGPLTLDAGLRLDGRRIEVEETGALGVEAQTRTYVALTGATGAAWRPHDAFSFAANLGRAFRAPTLVELFGNGVHEGTIRFERGDPALRPEHALALDAVVRWLTPHHYAEVSAFVNRIDRYIYPRPTGEVDAESGFAVYAFTQADAQLAGVEARLDVHPHALHGLGLHVSGDLTRGTNRATDAPLPFVPPARLQAAVEYRADALGPARDVELRFGPTFTAGQDRPELAEEVPTDAYAVWDASVAAAFPLPGGLVLRPTLAAENLTDVAYVDPLSRFRPYGVHAPGRMVRLRLALAFGE
jgi:iron complex outermembrane receptor protein